MRIIFFRSWTWQWSVSRLSLVMTQSSQSPIYMTYYFLWTRHHWTALKTWLNNDWLTQQAFMSDVPSQMHPFSINLWRVILIFMWFLFSEVLATLIIIQSYRLDWHEFVRSDVSNFDSLILSNKFLYFSCSHLLL